MPSRNILLMVLTLTFLLIMGCGSAETVNSSPAATTSYSGNWKRDATTYSFKVYVNTDDNVHYTGTIRYDRFGANNIYLEADIYGTFTYINGPYQYANVVVTKSLGMLYTPLIRLSIPVTMNPNLPPYSTMLLYYNEYQGDLELTR